jgi:hypothetical protein
VMTGIFQAGRLPIFQPAGRPFRIFAIELE